MKIGDLVAGPDSVRTLKMREIAEMEKSAGKQANRKRTYTAFHIFLLVIVIVDYSVRPTSFETNPHHR